MMSLRVTVTKLVQHSHTRILPHRFCSRAVHHHHACRFSTRQKDDTPESPSGSSTAPKGRKLVMSPDTKIESSAKDTSSSSSSSSTSTSTKTTRQTIVKPTTSTSSSSSSSSSTQPSDAQLSMSKRYAFDILNRDILESSKTSAQKYDLSAYSEQEQRLYKVVQHLIDEGFIDDIKLLKLSEDRQQLRKDTATEFNKLQSAHSHRQRDFAHAYTDKQNEAWMQETITRLKDEFVHHECVYTQPLTVNLKQFMLNRGYDPLQSLEADNCYELQLDDRDIRHLLLYLIYQHLNTKRFYELHPSIKELAKLMYGIHGQGEFNRLLNVMARTRRNIQIMVQSYPKQSPPHIAATFDKVQPLEHTKGDDVDADAYVYDEYGQHIAQPLRNMTSFELDTTLKRVQDLEFRQFGYVQPEARAYDADSDDFFVDIVQNEAQADETEAAKHEQIQKELKDKGIEDEDGDAEAAVMVNKRRGYYNSVMEKVQQRWNGDLMDMKYVGGDWRVRLGIAERPTMEDIDMEQESEKQYRRQLNESIAYTTRKRYKFSPWKIKSLPYAEAKELDLNFKNIKLLTRFVNDRGMILPRRFTGVDKRTQKKVAKAVKRARHMGLMPYMTRLLIFDKEKVQQQLHEFEVKKKLQEERDEYDRMNMDDLRSMYPEYAASDEQYDALKAELQLQQQATGGGGAVPSEFEIDFSKEYDIKEEEILYQTQLRKQQNIFMKQIKQDIVKKIPEYWQKRLSFRDKSNKLLNKAIKSEKQKSIESNELESKPKLLSGVDASRTRSAPRKTVVV